MTRILALFALLASVACAQTAAPSPVAIAPITLPTYVALGGAFNQVAGVNVWASAIAPISSSLGMYESTTADLFPVKTLVAGKAVYLFQASLREGAHKLVYHDANNALLFGADVGYSFAQASASGSATSGVSAAITITYVRHLSAHWSVMVPIRAMYLPTFGGWNPIVQAAIVWKP